MNKHPVQLAFDALLNEAAAENRKHKFDRETAHLPATMKEAIPFYFEQIKTHHAAMSEARAG